MFRFTGGRRGLEKATITLAVAAVSIIACAGRASAAPTFNWHRDGRWRELRGAPGGQRRAHAAIVGGSPIASEHAPWQVALLGAITAEYEGEKIILFELCGGAIIGESQVVTAAHCMFNPVTGAQAPAEDFLVVAGTSDLAEEVGSEQDVEAASIAVHPYFSYAAGPGTPDDVALLTLTKPLDLSGPEVRSIGIASAGSSQPDGAPVLLSGFGSQHAGGEPNGGLYALGMTLGSSEKCGGKADAVFVCASAPAGSACAGDSGSGLTDAESTPLLLGILSTVEVISEEACRAGAFNGFTSLAAPEIHDFLEGDPSPPEAPRGGSGMQVAGVPVAGNALTCTPGNWSGTPTFTYSFIDSTGGQVLQAGASQTYQLTAADVGRRILCQLQASNAGGTAVERTASLRAIEAAPAGPPPSGPPASGPPAGAPPASGPPASGPPASSNQSPPSVGEKSVAPPIETPEVATPSGVSLADATVTVGGSGGASVKLKCSGNERCTGKLTLTTKDESMPRGARKSARSVVVGTARFALAAGKTMGVAIDLNATGRALLRAAHDRLAAQLTIIDSASNGNAARTQSVHLVSQRTSARAKGPRS